VTVKSVSALAALLLLTGCAAMESRPAPPAYPEGAAPAVLGVKVRTYAPILPWSHDNHLVAFVKIEDDDDMFRSDEWIQSNYTAGDLIYLLGAEPGDYVAVASLRVQEEWQGQGGAPSLPGGVFVTLFDEKTIESSRTTVERGAVAFMGEILVKQGVGSAGSDPAQRHYHDLLEVRAMSYRGAFREHRKDAADRDHFIEKSRGMFADTEWSALFAPAGASAE
jgi:hypothetical protein